MSYRDVPTTTRVCVCDSCGATSAQARGASDFWHMDNRPLLWASYRTSRASKSLERHLCPVCVEVALLARLPKEEQIPDTELCARCGVRYGLHKAGTSECPNDARFYGPESFAPAPGRT